MLVHSRISYKFYYIYKNEENIFLKKKIVFNLLVVVERRVVNHTFFDHQLFLRVVFSSLLHCLSSPNGSTGEWRSLPTTLLSSQLYLEFPILPWGKILLLLFDYGPWWFSFLFHNWPKFDLPLIHHKHSYDFTTHGLYTQNHNNVEALKHQIQYCRL